MKKDDLEKNIAYQLLHKQSNMKARLKRMRLSLRNEHIRNVIEKYPVTEIKFSLEFRTIVLTFKNGGTLTLRPESEPGAEWISEELRNLGTWETPDFTRLQDDIDEIQKQIDTRPTAEKVVALKKAYNF